MQCIHLLDITIIMSRLGRFVKKFKLSITIMFYTLELIERKSFEYKIVDDLMRISFLPNIFQKEQVSLSVRLSRNIWSSYYSLLSPGLIVRVEFGKDKKF